jgi:hypothetical protein
LVPGSQAVQSIHSLHEFEKQQKQSYEDWYQNSKTIVLLSVESLDELEKLHQKLEIKNTCVSTFYEPDLNYALTSVCVLYCDKSRKLLRNLPLALSEFSKKEGGQHA